MELILVATCLFGVISTVYLFFKHRFVYWKNQGVPYLEPSIPWGNLPGFGKTSNFLELFDEIYRKLKDKAPFAGAYVSASPIAIITDLDLVKDILIKNFSSFHDRSMFYNEKDEPIAAHLGALTGQKWKRLRSILSTTFTSGKMKFMFPTILEVSERFVTLLMEEATKNDVFEMKEQLGRYTIDVIGTCAFGIECNSLKDTNSEFRYAGRAIFTKFRHRPIVQELLTAFPNIGLKLGMKNYSDQTNNFVMNMVRETIKYREENNEHRNDFMDMLISFKNNKILEDQNGVKLDRLTIEEIAAQVFIFFLAGFETTASTISYALYELALKPELQEIARKEISIVLKKYNEKLTYEAILDMKYIQQIVMETLRKYPPLALLTRKATKDYPVPRTDKVIKKGLSIYIPTFQIQRDPVIYPNPEDFDPDRFSPKEVKMRHPMSFLSFGDGPRKCIGLRFGKIQSYIGLIMLLRNFRVKICNQTVIPMTFHLNNHGLVINSGLYLRLEKI